MITLKSWRDLLKGKLTKISINKIFYDNKLVFLFSVFVSFAIWIGVNAGGADSTPVTISDIPVSISLSESAVQDGLRIFSGQDIKAQIDISGNKVIVGQVTKDDILITVPQAASTITSPGTYTLELTAKKTGLISNYEFASGVQPTFVTIMVDRYREAEFNIEPEFEFSANPNYFLGATVLSSPKAVLSGPESEISKIKKICVKGRIDQELQGTFTTKSPIIMYDAYGEQIISETISSTVKEVEVTIPVLMRRNISIKPNFKNIPSGLNLSSIVKTVPASLEIAGPEEQIGDMTAIELAPIDFSELNVQKNRMSIQIDLPNGCRSLNNIYSVEVFINTSGFKERTFCVDQISFLNVPEGKTTKVYTDKIDVKLVGPSNSIRYMSAENITAQIDLGGKEDLSGSMEIPVLITVKNYNDVWAYGKYLVNIEIS